MCLWVLFGCIMFEVNEREVMILSASGFSLYYFHLLFFLVPLFKNVLMTFGFVLVIVFEINMSGFRFCIQTEKWVHYNTTTQTILVECLSYDLDLILYESFLMLFEGIAICYLLCKFAKWNIYSELSSFVEKNCSSSVLSNTPLYSVDDKYIRLYRIAKCALGNSSLLYIYSFQIYNKVIHIRIGLKFYHKNHHIFMGDSYM